MRILPVSLLAMILALSAAAQEKESALKAELLSMRERDQAARTECAKGTAEEQMKCMAKVFETVDKPNTRRLNEIFAVGGFPEASAVGPEGVKAFFLLLQHSGDLELKKKCVSGIERAFKAGVLNVSEYSSFVDRLLVDQGKPQIYGSNFESRDGQLVMSPTEDVVNLDKRRKEIGLPTIAEYMKMLKEFYKLEVVLN